MLPRSYHKSKLWSCSTIFQPLQIAHFSSSSPISNHSESSVKSPRHLYNHLSQYIVGQERAKRILSVAVFNHYQRISHRLPDPVSPSQPVPPPQPSSFSSSSQAPPFSSSQPRPKSRSDRDRSTPSSSPIESEKKGRYETSRWDPSRTDAKNDATRVVGLGGGDGGDPTLTHDLRSREGQWARGDGYFSSQSIVKPSQRRGVPDEAAGRERRKEDWDREREREREHEREKEREMQRINDAEAKARARKELEEAIDPPRLKEEVLIEKSNVLMIGPTGTGKTLMAKTLAKALDVPFASVDATTYTQAGYVGDDVENCVLRLLQAADYDVNRAEIGIIHIDEVDKLARRGGGESGSWSGGRDVGGEGVQQALLRLLEGTNVFLSAKPPPISSNPGTSGSSTPSPSSPSSPLSGGPQGGVKAEQTSDAGTIGTAGGSTLPGSDSGPSEPPGWDPNNPMSRGFGAATGRRGVREGLPGFSGGGGPSGGKGETFVVDTSNILFILSGAFVGLESIVQRRLGKGSIGFGAPLPTPSSLLPSRPQPLAGVSTPDLSTYGLIPEFLGRLPVLSTLQPLSLVDLSRILREPRNALLKQYTALFDRYGVDLRFTEAAVEEIAKEGLSRGGGARGLRGVLEEILTDAMFEVPGSSVRYCLITSQTVKRRTGAEYFSRGQKPAFLAALESGHGNEPRRVDHVGPDPGGPGGLRKGEEEEEVKIHATG